MPKKLVRLMTLLLSVNLIVAFSHTSSNTRAHKKVLLRALKECEKIKSGSYDAVYLHQFPFQEEIESTTGHCRFSKLPADKILGARLDLVLNREDGSVARNLYDGRYEVMIYPQKYREARVSDHHQRSPYYIAGGTPSWLLFEPLLPPILFSEDKGDFFQQSIQKRAEHIHQLPDASVEGRVCSVFAVHCKDSEETKDEVITLFVDQASNILIKYVHKKVYWGAPTYTEAAISNCTFSHQEDPSCVPDARAELPEGYAIVNDYERARPQKELLAVDTVAPAWTLPTVQGDTLSLAALRGKVVLLSFWYKSFGPCLHYLKELQKLQDQCQHQDLSIVGINLYDAKEDLQAFLAQRGINYPNVLDNAHVADQYEAHTPNTFYLLDRSGKVRYASIEQEKFPHKELSKQIKKLLKQHQ